MCECASVCVGGGKQEEGCRATDQNQGQLPLERYVLLCCVTKWKSPPFTHTHAHKVHTHTHIKYIHACALRKRLTNKCVQEEMLIITSKHTHTHTHTCIYMCNHMRPGTKYNSVINC